MGQTCCGRRDSKDELSPRWRLSPRHALTQTSPRWQLSPRVDIEQASFVEYAHLPSVAYQPPQIRPNRVEVPEKLQGSQERVTQDRLSLTQWYSQNPQIGDAGTEYREAGIEHSLGTWYLGGQQTPDGRTHSTEKYNLDVSCKQIPADHKQPLEHNAADSSALGEEQLPDNRRQPLEECALDVSCKQVFVEPTQPLDDYAVAKSAMRDQQLPDDCGQSVEGCALDVTWKQFPAAHGQPLEDDTVANSALGDQQPPGGRKQPVEDCALEVSCNQVLVEPKQKLENHAVANPSLGDQKPPGNCNPSLENCALDDSRKQVLRVHMQPMEGDDMANTVSGDQRTPEDCSQSAEGCALDVSCTCVALDHIQPVENDDLNSSQVDFSPRHSTETLEKLTRDPLSLTQWYSPNQDLDEAIPQNRRDTMVNSLGSWYLGDQLLPDGRTQSTEDFFLDASHKEAPAEDSLDSEQLNVSLRHVPTIDNCKLVDDDTLDGSLLDVSHRQSAVFLETSAQDQLSLSQWYCQNRRLGETPPVCREDPMESSLGSWYLGDQRPPDGRTQSTEDYSLDVSRKHVFTDGSSDGMQ